MPLNAYPGIRFRFSAIEVLCGLLILAILLFALLPGAFGLARQERAVADYGNALALCQAVNQHNLLYRDEAITSCAQITAANLREMWPGDFDSTKRVADATAYIVFNRGIAEADSVALARAVGAPAR